ncbi:hypothetical protein ABT063_50400, partial [Streptomyces sp. NPDC002838]|uniref:hypothetical protein n=1 Tax=Streptomyces sp. NPDC002838 TaxID=3154436 RepID=UPI0033343212
GTGWTSIVPIEVWSLNTGTTTLLLSYQAGTGKAHLNTVAEDGAMNPVWQRDDWGTGWTSIVPGHVGAEPFLLSYKIGDGRTHVNGASSDGAMDQWWSGNWGAGWTSVVEMKADNSNFLLRYNSGSGKATLARIRN